MASKKNTRRPAPAAPSAPDTAPAAHPAPSADRAPGGATAAVQGALAANPGATAAAIATAAGVSASAAGKALAALEAAGQATRTPGQRSGRTQEPATWHPVSGAAEAAASGAHAEAAGTAGEPTGPIGADGAGDAGSTTAPTFAATGNDKNAAPADGREPSGAPLPAVTESAPQPPPEPGGPADSQDLAACTGDADDASEGHRTGTAGPAAGEDHGGPAADSSTAEDTGPGVPGAAAAGLAELAAAAAQRAAQALAGGDITTAISELDAARDSTAQARRLARTATSRSARAGSGMRPGQLRDRVRDHLAGHPGTSLTPYEIARVLGNSAGAVANALDRLVELGHAELASEHPRRYITTAAAASAS